MVRTRPRVLAMTHVGTACLCLPTLAKRRFLAVGLFRVIFYRLVIFISRRCPCSRTNISFNCSSVIGGRTLPLCASCISWISSELANSGLTILRLVRRCLASGVRMRRSMACFCISICCCACDLCCSWASLCCSSSIRRRRSSSNCGSSWYSSSLNLLFASFLRIFFEFWIGFFELFFDIGCEFVECASAFAGDFSSFVFCGFD